MTQKTSQPIRSHIRAEAYFTEVGRALAASLRDIEQTLNELDVMLDRLQPAHSGRIRLQWESRGKSRGYTGEKVPCPVVWSRHKLLGVWRAKRVPLAALSNRAKTSGEFEGNAHLVRAVLADLQTLLLLHRSVRGRFARFDGDWSKSQPQVTRRVQEIQRRTGQLPPAAPG